MDIKGRIIKYCQYQERCQREVRNKLYEWGARTSEVQELLIELISEQWIDEERFAKAFVRGKFRIKNWGKHKIVYALKQQQISEYCIRKGLEEIDAVQYTSTLQTLAERKFEILKAGASDHYKIKNQLYHYLQQKGFESDLINDRIQELFSKK